jgi:hypothetical protein
MTGWRHILQQRRTLALALVLVALLARMLIPTGYMPVVEDGRFVMALCPGQGPMPMSHGAMAGMDHASATMEHPGDHDRSGHMKDGPPCAFAGVALAATAMVDPVLLALAIVFIVRAVFRRPQPPLAAPLRFGWPPRTGPPLPA